MRILKPAFFFCLMTAALVASAEVQIIDGQKYECKDGVCMLVDEKVQEVQKVQGAQEAVRAPRIAQGYMRADEFIAFLEGREVKSPFAETGVWLTLLLVLLGGLAMNLTPCVLPMIPINLIVIGRSAKRGTAYGLGMAVAYGTLGVAAAFGGLAFGGIQGNPWFNAAVAFVFAALALALFSVWFIDLSHFRNIQTFKQSNNQTFLFPFFMGALSAILAGACVAPVLISVLLLTGKLYAEGNVLALVFPFVLGLGMALPWPFLGAGMKVLPRPGAWMKGVNRLFGVVVLGFAVWYGWIAWQGFSNRGDFASPLNVTPSTLHLHLTTTPKSKPILVDCWATWCKNCAAMDRVLEEPKVKRALEAYRVIRVQAEDISELRKIKGFGSIRGLPAFVVFE